jgi:hypothetical protein
MHRNRDREPAALAEFAFKRHAAADHAGKLLADVQAQPGPLVSSRRGAVHLHECLEQLCLILFADPYAGIDHVDFCETISVIATAVQFNAYFSLIGEFASANADRFEFSARLPAALPQTLSSYLQPAYAACR